MSESKGRYWLNFNESNATKPLVCDLAKNFEVSFSVRQATVSETSGIMAIELEAEREELKRAIAWLESEGVVVEPIEIGVIAG